MVNRCIAMEHGCPACGKKGIKPTIGRCALCKKNRLMVKHPRCKKGVFNFWSNDLCIECNCLMYE